MNYINVNDVEIKSTFYAVITLFFFTVKWQLTYGNPDLQRCACLPGIPYWSHIEIPMLSNSNETGVPSPQVNLGCLQAFVHRGASNLGQ